MKLSIITIGYNNREGMKATLDSVASQSLTQSLNAHRSTLNAKRSSLIAIEHIIVDGGSTDGTVDVIRDYESCIMHRALSIQLKWVSEKDKGIYNAMNKGIKMATGDYCLFLNSGDVLAREGVLERVAEEINKFKADIYYGDVVRIRSGKKQRVRYKDKLTVFDIFSPMIAIHHQAAFIKRALFKSIGNYREDMYISSDWYFFFDAVVCHKVATHHISVVVSICDMAGLSNNMYPDDPRRIHDQAIRNQAIDKYCELMGIKYKPQTYRRKKISWSSLMWHISIFFPISLYTK